MIFAMTYLRLYNIKKYLKEDLSIDKAWINWTDGDATRMLAHYKPAKLSVVYYMTYNSGTQFQEI